MLKKDVLKQVFLSQITLQKSHYIFLINLRFVINSIVINVTVRKTLVFLLETVIKNTKKAQAGYKLL